MRVDAQVIGAFLGKGKHRSRDTVRGAIGRHTVQHGVRSVAAPLTILNYVIALVRTRQKGKRALVIAACTTPWPFNILARQSRGAVRSVREILGTGGMKVRTCEIPGTRKMNGKLSEKEARRITARTRRIVRKIE